MSINLMNTFSRSKLYLAVLMIATLLSSAVFEGLKKGGHLPDLRDDLRLYIMVVGAILVVLIGVVSVALRQQRDKV